MPLTPLEIKFRRRNSLFQKICDTIDNKLVAEYNPNEDFVFIFHDDTNYEIVLRVVETYRPIYPRARILRESYEGRANPYKLSIPCQDDAATIHPTNYLDVFEAKFKEYPQIGWSIGTVDGEHGNGLFEVKIYGPLTATEDIHIKIREWSPSIHQAAEWAIAAFDRVMEQYSIS